MVVDVLGIEGWRTFRSSFTLLLANSMYTGAGIDVVVDSPVRSLAAVRERSWDFLKAWVQG